VTQAEGPIVGFAFTTSDYANAGARLNLPLMSEASLLLSNIAFFMPKPNACK
jgi:hypothetical protein